MGFGVGGEMEPGDRWRRGREQTEWVRGPALSAEFLVPQRSCLPVRRLLRKETVTSVVPVTSVTFAFVPGKADYSTDLPLPEKNHTSCGCLAVKMRVRGPGTSRV